MRLSSIVCLISVIALLAACAGKAETLKGLPAQSGLDPVDPRLMQELRIALDNALAETGRSVKRSVASAPSGAESRVFTVWTQAQYHPPAVNSLDRRMTGVAVDWMHRLPGDADGNGEVNIADLAAIGRHLNEQPDYFDPAGVIVPYYPSGNSFSYGQTAPRAGEGPYNWLLAAADCDGNGEVNVADVSTLAKHFGERVTDWRVYKHRVGSPTPMLAGTVPFADRSNNVYEVAHFDFVDGDTSLPGDVEYYVCAFDSVSGQEGPPSLIRPDWSGRVFWNVPLAVDVQADVVSGAAPLTVNFTASANAPEGGTAFEYLWAFTQSVDDNSVYFQYADNERSFTFNEPGIYDVQVFAQRNSHGYVSDSSASITVNVGAGSGPRWHLDGLALTAGQVGNGFSAAGVNGQAAVVGVTYPGWEMAFRLGEGPVQLLGQESGPQVAEIAGRPAVAAVDYSTITYRRAFDAAGTAWPAATAVCTPAGSFSNHCGVLLEAGGRPAVVFVGVIGNGTGQVDHLNLQYIVANDADGAAWGPVQILDDYVANGTLGIDAGSVAGRPFVLFCDTDGVRALHALDSAGASWGPAVLVTDKQFFEPQLIATDRPFCVGANSIGWGQDYGILVFRADAALATWQQVAQFDEHFHDVSAFVRAGAWGDIPVVISPDRTAGLLLSRRATDAAGASWTEPEIIDQGWNAWPDAFAVGNQLGLAYRGIANTGDIYVARYY
jgi:PKD repeat protein